MTAQITELAIISLASGFAVGYLIGIVKHLIDNGGRFDLERI